MPTKLSQEDKPQHVALRNAVRALFDDDAQPTNNGKISSMADFIEVLAIEGDPEDGEVGLYKQFKTPEQLQRTARAFDKYKVRPS